MILHHAFDPAELAPPPPRLTRPERQWLERQAADMDDRRIPRSLTSRTVAAANRLAVDAAAAITALTHTSAAIPPPPPPRPGRRPTGPANRTLAQVAATIDLACDAADMLGHLLDRCATPDGCRRCDTIIPAADIADQVGLHRDWSALCDALCATPMSSPLWAPQVVDAGVALAGAAADIAESWTRMRDAGADPDLLRRVCEQLEQLARRTNHLARETLGVWAPPTNWRRCTSCGRYPGPDRWTCGACRTSRSRHRKTAGAC